MIIVPFMLILLLVNSFLGKEQIHKQQQHLDLSPDSSLSGGKVAEKDSVSCFFHFRLSTFTFGYEFML